MSRRDHFLWAVVVEGAVDAFCGRPLGANPYDQALDSSEAWRYGYVEAKWQLDVRGEEEARRWLRGTA